MTSLSTRPGSSRATMRDVAQLAGVGIKTVSRVMNDEANVTADTRNRVLQAAAALDYVPDIAAGNLRRGDRRTRTLGLVVSDVGDPFFAEITRAVEEGASARGLSIFTSSSNDDPDTERAAVDAFTQRRVDGLLLACTSADLSFLARERQLGTPLVFFDRAPAGVPGDAVVADNAGAAARAVRHLRRHGHIRIAGLFDRAHIWTAAERAAGFQQAASGALPRVLMGVSTDEQATAAVIDLLRGEDPPTAVFTGRASITVGAIRALRHLGQQHQVALVGFDDIPTADLLEPGITVITQRAAHMGRIAVERLLQRIDGLTGTAETIQLPTDLIERGSGEINAR